jgi:hypothetical protein
VPKDLLGKKVFIAGEMDLGPFETVSEPVEVQL